jgi:hypothetical protein
VVHGNDHYATQGTSEKDGYPFRTALAPEQDALSSGDLAGFEVTGEAIGELPDLGVGPAAGAIATTMDVGGLALELQEFGDKIGDGLGGHWFEAWVKTKSRAHGRQERRL